MPSSLLVRGGSRATVALWLLWGSLGCDDLPPLPSQQIELSPQALDDHAVWIDQQNDQALYLDVTATRPEPVLEAVAIEPGPISLTRRNEHDELLLLSLGASRGSGSVLTLLNESGVARRVELGTRFDTLIQSDDGRFVFARVRGGTDDVLFNPNEVAIVDLDQTGSDAVTQRTLRSTGAGAQQVIFSPIMRIAGEDRRLAVVLSSSQAALLDLNYPERPEFTVELTQNADVGLNQVRFSADEQKIYLLGSNSNDIYVITLLPADANRENDFEPSLNTLGIGARPTDMTLYGAGSASRLLAVGGADALVIEAGSNRITRIPLGISAQRLHLFSSTAPFDSAVEERALIYGVGDQVVAFLDLEQVEERTTRNVETLNLGAPIASLRVLGETLVLVLHQNRGLSLLDLEERTVSPITATVDTSSTLPSLDLNRLWVGASGSQVLAYLDLEDFHPSQVELGAPIEQVLLFTRGKSKRVLVVHPSSLGRVTILDAERPERVEDAVMLEGFFAEGVLD